jgi:hypothetical protein
VLSGVKRGVGRASRKGARWGGGRHVAERGGGLLRGAEEACWVAS